MFVTEIKAIGKEANELDLIEAGLIADEDEYLTEYPRDIRDFLPEILWLIPAKPIQSTLKRSRRYAYSLRNGERRPSDEVLPKVIQLASGFARGILGEMGEPEIPSEDKDIIRLAASRLGNSPDPQPLNPAE